MPCMLCEGPLTVWGRECCRHLKKYSERAPWQKRQVRALTVRETAAEGPCRELSS